MEDVQTNTVDRLGSRSNHVRVLHVERNRDTVAAEALGRQTHSVASWRGQSRLRPGLPCQVDRTLDWIKCKNPASPAVKREAEDDWQR
jgi:hypothetical protein